MTPQHHAALRSRLAQLHCLQVASDRTDQKIRTAADARLHTVQQEIQRLHPQVLLSQANGDRYQDLIAERAALNRVLAPAP